MASLFRGLGKVRAHGKARIAITLEARDEAEFQRRWHKPAYDYPFAWERGWKYCLEYRVDDFPAEVGFFIDVLGMPVATFSPSYAQFISPDQELLIGITPTGPADLPAQPEGFRLQLFIVDLEDTVNELVRRGVIFDEPPGPAAGSNDLLMAAFSTPNGLQLELWGFARLKPVPVSKPTQKQAAQPVSTRHTSSSQPDRRLDLRVGPSIPDETEEEQFDELEDEAGAPDEVEDELEDEIDDGSGEDYEEDYEEEYEEDDEDEDGAGSQLSLQRLYRVDEDYEDDEEDTAGDSEDLSPEEADGAAGVDEEARLDRLLHASKRLSEFTFDERLEPAASVHPIKNRPRSAPRRPAPGEPEKSSRDKHREATPLEPIYADLDDNEADLE